ncbi:MAG: hypothetical protein GX994_01840 [Firmicutes bacterium]|nr:hypothetical protein [Bacillota bacterium]
MKQIQDLVFQFFKLCSLKPVEIRKGIFQVHIDEQLAKELDGWRAKGRLFQFTFNKQLAETYGAELISYGSYRLNALIRLIKKQAILASGYLPHNTFYEPAIRSKILNRLEIKQPGYRWYLIDYKYVYGPYLWFTVLLTYLAYEKREELRKIPVDLVNGKVVNYEIPADLLKPGTIADKQPQYRRKLSYKQAYTRLQEELTEQLSFSDPAWAIIAAEQVEAERTQLEDYFQSLPDSKQKNIRIAELMKRAKPRVEIRPLRAAYLYLPKLEYRIMQVGNRGKINRIIYDPVSNQYEVN